MRRFTLGMSVAGLLVTAVANADQYTLVGTNAESVAKGGALTAGASGSSGAFYNPATLNMRHKQESEFTYIWARPSLYIDRKADSDMNAYLDKYKNDNGETKSYNVIQFKRRVNDFQEKRAEDVPLIRGYNIGLVVPLAEDRTASRASLGLSLYMPQGPIMRQRINAPETPYFVEFDDRTQRLIINAGIGYDITDRLHIGGGASFLMDIEANVDVFVPINFNVVDLIKSSGGNLNLSVTPLAQAEVPPVISPTAGVLWDVTDFLSLGASYRDEVKAEVKANARILAETGTGRTTALPVKLNSSASFTPRQVALGTKVKPHEKLTVYADATWSQWSKYKPPVAEFSISNMKQLVNELILGSGVSDLGILGGEIQVGGQGFAVPSTDEILDQIPDYVRVKYEVKGFRNIWTPRFGVAYEATEQLTVMGGYFYRPTIEDKLGIRVTRITDFGGVVTRERLNQNTLDNTQHGLSGGAVYTHKNMKFGVTGLYIQLVEKTVDKTADDNLTYPDDSKKVGLQTTSFGYPGYKYGGSVYGAMFQGAIAF